MHNILISLNKMDDLKKLEKAQHWRLQTYQHEG